MRYLVVTLLLIISFIVPTILVVKSVKLEQQCTGYLKRAADANTVDMALVELTRAIDYLEENKITEGYTSILWKTPDEDIGFWYNNLKASQKELMNIDSTATQLERSNVLMKLRETLVDNDSDGTSLTVPAGLSRFPANTLWAVLLTLSILSICLCIVAYFVISDI